ncbi:uncharacterized protein LOC133822513 [Humulus lupulus]|uniref:uncharacterized protein LOC133822513 n=1 Tax=Humulus lupulus TaxID=3486 RepID=UPI002B412CB5|nr:uncharacterized protein LOC133822513 [Humulus lupulus]
MPKLLVPFSDHFPGRVTYRGSSTLNHIKTRFLELGLLERAKESPFKQFFLASEFNFSGVLVHQLLLRKIANNNEDEVHFFLGSKSCRFGMGEFALVTGLDFSAFPSPEELEGRNLSDRLIKEYFNDAEKVKLSQVDHAFKTCTVVEDVYKLGLCLFVEGVLNAIEGKLHIWRDILKIVENVEYFFSYPWGKYSYRRLLHSCKKDMVKQKANYDAKKDAKVQQESKYSMYGYAPALQYWAYEAIQQLAVELVVSSGNMFPRMLSWSHRRNKDFTKSVIAPILLKKNLIVLPMLKPRPAEKDYYLSLTEGDLPLYPGLGQDPSETDEEEDATFEKMAEKVSQAAEAAKIFVDAAPGEEVAGPTPPIPPASAPASTCAPASAPASTCAPTSAPASVSAPTPTPPPASASAPELADLIERLDRVEGRQETLLKNQSVILDVLSQILTFVKEKPRGSNEDSELESLDLPLDYVDDPTTPPTIIVTPDAETPGVVIVNPEDVAGVQFQRARRQRRKPDWFEDYTDPTRKRPRTAAAAPADEATQEATHECFEVHAATAPKTIMEKYDAWILSNNSAKGYMLSSMSDVLRKKHEDMETAFDLWEFLQAMFGQQSDQCGHVATITYLNMKMKKGVYVKEHVLSMINTMHDAKVHGATIYESTQILSFLRELADDVVTMRVGSGQILTNFSLYATISVRTTQSVTLEEMELPGALDLRGAFKVGGTGASCVVKWPRVTKKIALKMGSTTKSLFKDKGASTAREQPQRELPLASVTTVTIQQDPHPPPRHIPPSNP